MVQPPRWAERRRLRLQALRVMQRLRGGLGRPRLPGRTVPMALALQGGGAHGAFTWGVLDRLLEEPSFRLTAVSGASAGAMNAVVLASGWMHGGRQGARDALERFWRTVGRSSGAGPLQPSPMDYLSGGWNRDHSPSYQLVRSLAKVASPYQFNPTGFNPLAGMLRQCVDFEGLRQNAAVRVYVSMTHVPTGRLRLVTNEELSVEVLLASACLPLLFQAVEIDGEPYWDGGYSANPALYPLIFGGPARDVMLVQLSPVWHQTLPTRVNEILDRINDISFNSHLLRELQMLALMDQTLSQEPNASSRLHRRLRRLRLHHIHADGAFEEHGRSSPMNAEWPFLKHLRDQGRERAEQWLRQNGAAIGRAPSLNLSEYGA